MALGRSSIKHVAVSQQIDHPCAPCCRLVLPEARIIRRALKAPDDAHGAGQRCLHTEQQMGDGGVGLVVHQQVRFGDAVHSEGHRLQDVLVCIRHGVTLDEPTALRRLNSEYYLKSPQQMAALFDDLPEAIANTRLIADRCRFDLRYGLQDLPHFATPHGMSSSAYLHRLCREGVAQRYGLDAPDQVYRQLAHELAVIERAGLANVVALVCVVVLFMLWVLYVRVLGSLC